MSTHARATSDGSLIASSSLERRAAARPPRSREVSTLAAIYGRAQRFRRTWYERHPDVRRVLDRPVVSVGNLALGGRGKTPVVAAVARILQAHGHTPSVLSRGYGRRCDDDGVVVVSDGERTLAPVERSGDEPLMLARALPGVPVLVSADRYVAGRLAECRFGCTVHILDDGFQHLQLARVVDLLLVDPCDLHDRVLPAGRLREPLSAARAAHAVLVHGDERQAAAAAETLGVGAAFRVITDYGELQPIAPGEATPVGRVFAVAGIARPERLFHVLATRGLDVVGRAVFRDHHWFTPRDVERIEAEALAAAAQAIVTTEKDLMRLEPLLLDVGCRSRQVAWTWLPMQIRIEPRDRFESWLRARV
jgi:tetraacyldisaccharide 4'-kinase